MRLHRIDQPPLPGRLVHVDEDFGFDFEPSVPCRADADLAIQLLAVTADSVDGIIAYIWGYSPRVSWEPAVLTAPERVEETRLVLDDPSLLVSGAGRALHPDEDWRTRFDGTKGLCEVRLRTAAPSTWFRIAAGTVIGLSAEREIAAVQLTPDLI